MSAPVSDPQDGVPPWQHHENHVAALYSRLGFKVTQNINVDGQQVDIVCEKWVEGVGRTRLCIDCKHTRLDENRSVSKDDVDQFIFTFRNRAESHGWTAGIMVSNRPFSQYAKAAAAKYQNIHLKTINELHEEILHIHSYLYESIRQYEESHHFFDFIFPSGSVSNDPKPSLKPSPVKMIVDRWLVDENSPQLCLLGDFGTGKTTFLEYLHYTLAKEYIAKSTGRIPLFISLRKYYEATDHEDLIKQFFSLECATSLQYQLFQEFLSKGRLLLLLDGFDEMGAKSDPLIRKANYLKLAGFVEGKSKILISCRPAYFLSLDETQSVFSFVTRQIGFAPPVRSNSIAEGLFRLVQDSDLDPVFHKTKDALNSTTYLNLSLFNNKQIRAYLKIYNDDITRASAGQLNARRLFLQIKRIYDLEDLAKRPILLKLIVSTLPLFRKTDSGKFKIELGGREQEVAEVTPSVLYTVYTEKELEREYKKGKIRWLIERADKSRIIAAIAFEMFRQDTLTLDKRALNQVVEKAFPDNDTDQAYYLTDIRTCSFLTRDGQDAIRFTHKSFMEYYTSLSLRMKFTNSESVQNLLSRKPLSDEISFFLGDGIAAPDSRRTIDLLKDVYRQLSSVDSPSESCVQNVLNVLNYARHPISPLRKTRISTLVYRKLNLKQQAWEDVHVEELRTIKFHVTKLSLNGVQLKQWNADEMHASKVVWSSVDVRGLRFWDSQIENLEVFQSALGIETWRNSKVKKAVFKNTAINSAGDCLGSDWIPEDGEFYDCILVGLDIHRPKPSRLKYGKCTFVMCKDPGAVLKDLDIQDCRGVLVDGEASGSRNLSNGLVSCGASFANQVKDRSAESFTWEEAVISVFGTDIRRLPKSETEIRMRLRQAAVALELSQQRGQPLTVLGYFETEEECRLLRCDAHSATMLRLRTNEEFTHSLRRASLQKGDPLRINFVV